MVVDFPPGQEIRFEFGTPLENSGGDVATAFRLALLPRLLVLGTRWEPLL